MSFWKLYSHNSFERFYYILSKETHYKLMWYEHWQDNFRSDSEVTHQQALLYASGMVILNGIGVLTINQLFMTGYYNGMKARVAVCSIIFRKVNIHCNVLCEESKENWIICIFQALRLSHAELENTSPGKVVNLLSNDVYRFDAMSMFLNALWTAPLLVIAVGYLLWIEVQWAGMFGLLVVFIIVPIQSNSNSSVTKYEFQCVELCVLIRRLFG